MIVSDVWITMADGIRLAATLYLPAGDGPFAVLLEALPYRKDDLTASYRDSYVRFADEAGFAVCRLDLRGTGSSGGTATDEYPTPSAPLRAVINWCHTAGRGHFRMSARRTPGSNVAQAARRARVSARSGR